MNLQLILSSVSKDFPFWPEINACMAMLIIRDLNTLALTSLSIVMLILFLSLKLFLRHLKYPAMIQVPAVSDIERLASKHAVLSNSTECKKNTTLCVSIKWVYFTPVGTVTTKVPR